MFSNLISKIFGHASAAAPDSSSAPAAVAAPASPPLPAASAMPAVPAPVPAQAVDVTAILDDLAKKNPEKLDWRRSIVDLMKLVGMDSGLSARKQLAGELQYSGDQNDSAAMNVWLHKQVIKKIAENGGKVPPELLT
jgi:3-oxoacyl-ACP reductase-like protein